MFGYKLLLVKAPPTNYPKYKMAWAELVALMLNHCIELQFKPQFTPDTTHLPAMQYTDESSWNKLLPWVRITASAYTPEQFDCDDYARKCAVDMAYYFGLNGCIQVWGRTPLGYHAFMAMPVSLHEIRLAEPNKGFSFAGKLFKPTENGYYPTSWKP